MTLLISYFPISFQKFFFPYLFIFTTLFLSTMWQHSSTFSMKPWQPISLCTCLVEKQPKRMNRVFCGEGGGDEDEEKEEKSFHRICYLKVTYRIWLPESSHIQAMVENRHLLSDTTWGSVVDFCSLQSCYNAQHWERRIYKNKCVHVYLWRILLINVFFHYLIS